MKRILHAAGVAVLLFSSACATRSEVIPGGSESGAARPSTAPSGDHHDHAAMVHAGQAVSAAGPGYTSADVEFMQGMIGHHAQALLMTALAPSRGATEHVLQLAEKIDISQRDEIEMMVAWLRERKQPVPDSLDAHHAHMPGMLTQAQLEQLAAARGREFDRLFLTLMIQHHEGALVMVQALFASPGAAQDSDIFRFATDVATDQLDEIDVMHHMLRILEPTRGS